MIIHLLPRILYKWILELFSEQESTVKELLTIKYTRCTIEMFRRVVKQTDYQIVNEQLYFINPHYKIKFGLTPHKLNKTIACIPFIRNVFSTSCFYSGSYQQANYKRQTASSIIQSTQKSYFVLY